ncbi:MAG: sensor histidine kinase [Chloroflexi bacterium]|nr:sensor histidine kinase [Chloroflexota bacterium]
MEVLAINGQPYAKVNTDITIDEPIRQTRLLSTTGELLDVELSPKSASQGRENFFMWTLGGVFALLGTTVVLRRPDLHAARMFWLFAGMTAIALAAGPSSGLGFAWARIVQVLSLVGVGATLLPFVSMLTRDRLASGRSLVAPIFASLGIIITASYGASLFFVPPLYQLVRPMFLLYVSTSVVAAVGLLAVKGVRQRSPAGRQQARIVLLGIALGTLPVISLTVVPEALGYGSLLPVHLPILALGLIPVSFAYAILQYQLLGIRKLVHRGMVYGLATFALLLLVALVLTLAPLPNEVVANESQPVWVSTILVGAVLLFFVLRRSALWLVDNFIYRDVVNYRSALEVFRRDLPAPDRLPEVAELIARRLAQIVHVESVLLYLGHEPAQCQLTAAAGERTQEILGHVRPHLETYIEGSKTRELAELHWESDSLLLVNLSVWGRYLGYVLLGPKMGGEIFLEEEKRLVATITPLLALAFEKSMLSEELRGVNQRLTKAEEAERGRIAGDLHDGPLQKAITLAGGVSSTGNGQVNLARQLVLELREICSRLRPAILDDLGIVPALDWLLDGVSQQSGIKALLSLLNVSEEDRFSPETELALFRVTQEATNNAVKHAKGTSVEVSLSREGHSLVLKVADDGIGFAASSYGKGGFGLSGMRERVMQVGGSFEINSAPELGTTIIARVPLG